MSPSARVSFRVESYAGRWKKRKRRRPRVAAAVTRGSILPHPGPGLTQSGQGIKGSSWAAISHVLEKSCAAHAHCKCPSLCISPLPPSAPCIARLTDPIYLVILFSSFWSDDTPPRSPVANQALHRLSLGRRWRLRRSGTGFKQR